ncbi:MAG: pyruvate kinase, partial [Ilumatobacteraceae bacterium]
RMVSRRTKIVATIGPASDSVSAISDLLYAGVDVFRINLSHGEIEGNLDRLRRVREASKVTGHEVAVLADLPGPKIRVCPFPEGGVEMMPGAEVMLSEAERPSSGDEICVNVAGLFTGLAEDDQVVLGDGNIMLRVTSPGGQSVIAQVVTGGRVQGAPGVHVPSERLSASTPTPDDLLFAEQMAAAGVEFIAVSFVRTARDIDEVRKVVGDRAQLIAKIETSAALAALTDIVSASDGVMVARGDLGIDCPLEEVPHLQKMIIRECVERGVPVITATQMLESMVSAAVPTRAEASDVANAVFDGTDAVMLSGETAVGDHPVIVVETMSKIAARAERQASYRGWAARLGRHQRGSWNSVEDRITAALGNAASQAARDIGATAILCCTQSGRTARAMARFRPEATLIGLSPDETVVRALRLSWGVDPMPVDVYESTDEMVWYAVEKAVQQGRIRHGDTVLVLAGAPGSNSSAAADVLRVVQVA